MIIQQFPSLRALHIESLKTQRQLMLVVQDRHQGWINDIDGIEINRIRCEIIDLIGKTVEQYDQLLEALQKQGEGT